MSGTNLPDIDVTANANVTAIDPGNMDKGFLAAVSAVHFGGVVIAAPMQLITTKAGVPIGWAMVPPGWSIAKQGFPRGYSVSWDAGSGVSIIHDEFGNPVGRMVAPQSVSSIAQLPVQNFSYTAVMYSGYVVAAPTDADLAAMKSVSANGLGIMYLVTDPGTNYGGPDGGASR